ncbi:pyridoxamine 5'-phosphate oxidase family protein [soil metagenome]
MLWFDARTGIEMIERWDCLQLLAGETIGRLAIIEGGHPLVLPVNYVLHGEEVVFATNEGSKLAASRGGHACFEIDGFDRDRRTGWSVIVRGRLERLSAIERTVLEAADSSPDPWTGHRTDLVHLVPEEMSGRRVRPR